ncbi:MAG TPA: hypothetical protein VD838_09720 [Anaeromyxobacteraceae bacterium]|nr:hypothetical protein [Anaeromyxobacteraceae bacterium]
MSKPTSERAAKKSAGTGGNSAGNSVPASAQLRSEGQRLLLALDDSLATVAKVACVGSRTTVKRWRDGSRQPESEQRRHLKRAYGIPLEAWDCAPAKEDAKELDGDEVDQGGALAAEVPASSAAHFLELMQEVRAARTGTNLAPLERLRAIEREGSLRTQYERARGADLAIEERIVREHPHWHRFEEVVLKALAPWPDAARAVVEAIEKAGI